jgi:CHAT domain-containing protein
MGLARAFLLAGSRQVLCSLWRVDDEATAALMKAFYDPWNPTDGRPPMTAAAALRHAQDTVRKVPHWSTPTHWAGWVLWGD